MIRPKALKIGDTIGIINVSMVMDDRKRIDRMIDKLKSYGFKVKLGKSCYSIHGFLSGDDYLRANDLNTMFKDPEVQAIVCIRGGYGALRILNLIDYENIIKNPKIFIGYSDITALHIAINAKTNLVTFHGPMLKGEFEEGLYPETYHYLEKILYEKKSIEYVNTQLVSLVNGSVTAPIIGGNLSMIVSTLGTPYEINTKGKILFFEEIDEAPYKVDRMLTQLNMAGKLDDCVGFIVGQMTDCIDDYGVSVDDVINNRIIPKEKPALMYFQAGHTSPNFTIPLGVNAYLNTFERRVIINESVS